MKKIVWIRLLLVLLLGAMLLGVAACDREKEPKDPSQDGLHGEEETEYNSNITNDVLGGVGKFDCTQGWSSFFNAPSIKASGISYGLLPLPTYDVGYDYVTTADNISYFAFLTTTPNYHPELPQGGSGAQCNERSFHRYSL